MKLNENQLRRVVNSALSEVLRKKNKRLAESRRARTSKKISRVQIHRIVNEELRKVLKEMAPRKAKGPVKAGPAAPAAPANATPADNASILRYIHKAAKREYPGFEPYKLSSRFVTWGDFDSAYNGDGSYWSVENDENELWLEKWLDGEVYRFFGVKDIDKKSPEQVWSEVVKEFESGEGLRDLY